MMRKDIFNYCKICEIRVVSMEFDKSVYVFFVSNV